MTALTDPRPHVFMELPINLDGYPCTQAKAAGALVEDLLDTWPDVDLPTVRIWQHEPDGVPTIRVDARRGPLPGVDCPQCHQPIGRPHTEYCPLAIREEVFADGPVGRDNTGMCTDCGSSAAEQHAPTCQHSRTTAELWVDDGCRCPNPNQHLAGCPTTQETDERCGWNTDHQPHEWEDGVHKHHCDGDPT